jgi:hypothetical protein
MAEEARGGRADTVILLLQEILVDVVGITIPGFCFIVSTGAALGLPLLDLTREIGAVKHAASMQNLISQNVYFPSFIALMVFSFVVGHLLYRRDPKKPDLYSMEVCEADLPSGRLKGGDEHCQQFPYGFLKEYLLERGFIDLANYVPWAGTDFINTTKDPATSNRTKRTKHFINIKKLEVKQKSSGLYFDIVKNEAHIRLMSSIWYGAKALLALSLLGFVMALIANAIHLLRPSSFANTISATRAGTLQLPYADSIVLPLLVFLSSFWARRSIGRFFHYQRVREIVFVLQAYHLTQKGQPASSGAETEVKPLETSAAPSPDTSGGAKASARS